MVTFVVTSVLLAATPWSGGDAPPALTAGVFVVGVGLLLVALVLKCWGRHLGLRTVDMEIGGERGTSKGFAHGDKVCQA